jgi:hypothetical protein
VKSCPKIAKGRKNNKHNRASNENWRHGHNKAWAAHPAQMYAEESTIMALTTNKGMPCPTVITRKALLVCAFPLEAEAEALEPPEAEGAVLSWEAEFDVWMVTKFEDVLATLLVSETVGVAVSEVGTAVAEPEGTDSEEAGDADDNGADDEEVPLACEEDASELEAITEEPLDVAIEITAVSLGTGEAKEPVMSFKVKKGE